MKEPKQPIQPNVRGAHEKTNQLNTIQKMCWNAHDQVFKLADGLADDKKNQEVPVTQQNFYSKA